MAQLHANESHGIVQIADEVIAVIAGTAASEVDGVAHLSGTGGELVDRFGKRHLSKGVKIVVTGHEVKIDMHISVKFGYAIHTVGETVQKKVRTAIETMTGLHAHEINVHVTALTNDKPPKHKKEDGQPEPTR